MIADFHKDITLTSKGQLTLPVKVRRALNLGTKRKVRVQLAADGSVNIRPLPDVMTFFGKLKGNIPFDPDEKAKAREAMTHRATRKH